MIRPVLSASLLPAFLLLAAPAVPAQIALVLPDGAYATVEGDSNFAFPWNRGAGDVRVQYFQDSTAFTGQGVTTPIRITRLRYRADAIANTWSGGVYPSVQIDMSTCPVDHTAVTSTFANNHGPDRTTVFNGPVTVTGGAGGSIPGPWHVDVALTTPFVYDPTGGADLAIDVMLAGAGWVGTGAIVDHVSIAGTPGPLGSRVWDSSAAALTTPTAQWVQQNFAAVCEVTYEPTTGLWPNFVATPTTGTTPLAVQFTDRSVSDDPGGVLVWQWDLDGDGLTDANVANPSFVYNSCGSYTVSLTVFDATNGMRTLTRPGFVVTDTVDAGFTWTVLPGNTVSFTDTSTPAPTAWAWDLDGDGITDSTLQNPVFAYGGHCGGHLVSLTASRLCGPPATRTEAVTLAPNTLTTALTGGIGFFGPGSGCVFDVQVGNPKGVNVCAITNCPYSHALPEGSPVGCEVWVTDAPGGAAAHHADRSVWRLAATGTGVFQGGNAGSPVPIAMALDRPVYLPAGSLGVAVHMTGCGIAYSGGTASSGNGDLTILPVGAKSGIFNGSISGSRRWNGTLHYDTAQTGGGAAFGFFGAGCAGTLGTAGQSFAALPQLGGTILVTVDRLPASAMFYLLGFSRTTSVLGPLPVDLGPLGAPGCPGRVSADAAVFSVGAGNSAAWALGIPANPVLNGQEVFTQPLVPDPGFNGLGATTGDAWAMLIGI